MTFSNDIRMPSEPDKYIDKSAANQWHSIIGDAKKVLRCPECTRPVNTLELCQLCTYKLKKTKKY